MKITKSRLKQIIKEELESVLNEDTASDRDRAAKLASAADTSAASGREVEKQKIIDNAKLADYKQQSLRPYFNRQWKELGKKLKGHGVTPQGLERSAEQLVNTFFKPWDNMKSSLGPRYKFVQASKDELIRGIYDVIDSKEKPGGDRFPWYGTWLRDALDTSYSILGGVGHRGEEDAKEARVIMARRSAEVRLRGERSAKNRANYDEQGNRIR